MNIHIKQGRKQFWITDVYDNVLTILIYELSNYILPKKWIESMKMTNVLTVIKFESSPNLKRKIDVAWTSQVEKTF